MASPLIAAGAYANIARLATDPSQALGIAAGQGAGKSDSNVASMLKDAIVAVDESGRKSDAQAQAVAADKSRARRSIPGSSSLARRWC
jgi:flagellar hook-basal body complex protein FliE